jgi:ABC-2 type transport system ATP-binding protein
LYFRNELKKMKQKGTTIIITSHYQEDIDDLCDSVYEMDGGTLSKYEKN